MGMTNGSALTADDVLAALRAFIAAGVAKADGDTRAIKPGHRVPFRWPPHPASYRYHVRSGDWRERTTWTAHGEVFPVAVAQTPQGVFGRCEVLWHEARGDTMEQMLASLAATAEPLFKRQFAISEILGLAGRFTGHVRDLGPVQLVQLLYCPDRDVANEARTEIETHASLRVFTQALIAILRDDHHPQRRSAQWCALDLFEDMPSFCETPAEVSDAVVAMRDLLWNASDDYARTVFKAGVVLGGHLPDGQGGAVLTECLGAPNPYGRRSAIHGLFHVVEWRPEQRDVIVAALRSHRPNESDPLLSDYVRHMADDIEAGRREHVDEPVFEDESA